MNAMIRISTEKSTFLLISDGSEDLARLIKVSDEGKNLAMPAGTSKSVSAFIAKVGEKFVFRDSDEKVMEDAIITEIKAGPFTIDRLRFHA